MASLSVPLTRLLGTGPPWAALGPVPGVGSRGDWLGEDMGRPGWKGCECVCM